MSEEKPQKEALPEDSPQNGESSSLVPSSDKQNLEQRIEELISVLSQKDLSPPQQERIVHRLREVFTTYVERGSSQKIDPEIFKIAADTVAKDNENKYKYLSQKQQDAASENKREYDYKVGCHKDRTKILWPIIIVVLLMITCCVGFGIYFAATGHEILGASLLTGIFGAVFGYLAGIGTADFFREK